MTSPLYRKSAIDRAVEELTRGVNIEPTNNPNMPFVSLLDEKYRQYHFVREGQIVEVRIENPKALHVAKSGSNRVLDSNGVSHYIPAGWFHLVWEVKDNFAFKLDNFAFKF